MTTRVIRSQSDIDGFARLLSSRKLPVTVTVTAGAQRTSPQNRLLHQWNKDVADQLGDRTPQDVRAFCKLHFGVPILRAENEAYRVEYDRVIRPLPYETKISLMGEPHDVAVTRMMTVKQLTAYLDAVHRHWSEQGVRLTDPAALMYQDGDRQ